MRPKTRMFVLGVVGDFSSSIKHQTKMPVRCAALLGFAGLSEEGMKSIIAVGEELSGQGIVSMPLGVCKTSRQDNSPPLPLTVTGRMLLSQHPVFYRSLIKGPSHPPVLRLGPMEPLRDHVQASLLALSGIFQPTGG